MGILSAELSGQFLARFGDRFSISQALREQHGRGEPHHAPAIPDAVELMPLLKHGIDPKGIMNPGKILPA
ncbi:hypothetical protein HGP16_32560 [Rhizobium sp. P40RR-XXII]|uniref:FAD-linked oxidase C-terminal domain-containing protein n=1 Tax=unclassified Rhizobium TaxID=2613769 RepID=UPI001456FD86|nr:MULTISPECIES: FAD-linked oxidase C-terminal domain-containing protein [unclassified Rhizobium]NLR89346.1 hypothetical protein [Rhizobium sp. P28RR-XV]NLS21232.1 hypothetical protein [Rhizobium sp. P40RR-XXII]